MEPHQVPARIGGLGVYATPARLIAYARSPGERFIRTAVTLIGSWLLTPVAFLIPPHLEPAVVAILAGLYFARRAWVGEWVAEETEGTCPRCNGAITLKAGTVLFLPHSITCPACRAECWMELAEAPVVSADLRQSAMEKAIEKPRAQLGGRPPQTWSPAASDWRDRRRDSNL